jgi:hypothetical protein
MLYLPIRLEIVRSIPNPHYHKRKKGSERERERKKEGRKKGKKERKKGRKEGRNYIFVLHLF